MINNNSQLSQSNININHSLQVTAILAISLDGKITPAREKSARFSSKNDLVHLEKQVSLCDAIIFGASTLRAYGTTILVKNSDLLAQRQQRQQTPQPINIVCSSSGNLDPNYRFFSQSVERILLTTNQGFLNWQSINNNSSIEKSAFQQVIINENNQQSTINWIDVFSKFKKMKLKKIGVLGGAKLFSSLLAENLIDDLWLTLCPVIFANNKATNLTHSLIPFSANLKLLSYKTIASEFFLHYQIIKPVNPLVN